MSASRLTTVPSHLYGRNLRHILLAALLAVLVAAAVYRGFHSRIASAAQRPASPSRSVTPATEQSLPVYPASSDADVGPGDVEPILVGSP